MRNAVSFVLVATVFGLGYAALEVIFFGQEYSTGMVAPSLFWGVAFTGFLYRQHRQGGESQE